MNLARKLGLDAEQALRDATDRFARRFGHVERTLAAEGRAVATPRPTSRTDCGSGEARRRG